MGDDSKHRLNPKASYVKQGSIGECDSWKNNACVSLAKNMFGVIIKEDKENTT